MYFNQLNVFITGLLLVGLACCQCPSKNISLNAKRALDYEVVANDAAWCWFSDPRAVYYKGQKNQIYYGYINSLGDVMVGSRSVNDSITHTAVLHKMLNKDDHAVPSILILPDGKLLVFYSAHNGHKVYMRKSTYPEDITSWEDERVIFDEPTMRYTYTSPVMLSDEDNRIYLFGRVVPQIAKTKPRDQYYTYFHQYFTYSDDLGETWSKGRVYLKNSRRNDPIYLKVCSDNKSRIDFLFTDGHPKIGNDVSVYHMYYQKGDFYQTDGEKIAAVENVPIDMSQVQIDKVYDASESHIRSWIWDIALDKENRPVVTYSRYPRVANHLYYYAYWDGVKWHSQKIAKSGRTMCTVRQGAKLLEAHYSGGVVLDHNDPSNVYLSRQIKGNFEIEHKRWNGKKWISEMITTGSTVDNVRPYVVAERSDRIVSLLWMTGYYYHYTDFKTSLSIATLYP